MNDEINLYGEIIYRLSKTFPKEQALLKTVWECYSDGRIEKYFLLSVKGVSELRFKTLIEVKEFVDDIYRRFSENEWTVDRLLSKGGI